MIKSNALLIVIYQRLKANQFQQRVIHTTETPVKVIHEDKSQWYMWVYCTSTGSQPEQPPPKDDCQPPSIMIYDYLASLEGQLQDYLQGYSGYLQADGFSGYEQTDATLVGCIAHARRKFMDVKKTQGNGKADWAMVLFDKLYRIERDIKHKTPTEKQAIRQEKVMPLLQQLKDWLEQSFHQVTSKSTPGTAIGYCLHQWPKLVRYLEDGEFKIDSNQAERAVKPFVIGRKNWMFSNAKNGMKACAVLYSTIETAKANGVEPYAYLKLLIEKYLEILGRLMIFFPGTLACQNKGAINRRGLRDVYYVSNFSGWEKYNNSWTIDNDRLYIQLG